MSLSDLLEYWFPTQNYQEYWFDGSKDHEIKELFGSLLSKNELIKSDIESEMTCMSNEQLLAYILLFDQISRNISKLDDTNYKRNDDIALKMSQFVINNNRDIEYKFHMRMFIILPFRHSRTTKNLDFAISRLKEYESSERFSILESKLFTRFRLATLKDYSRVTDTIRVVENHIDIHPEYNDDIHDVDCKNWNDYPRNDNEIIKNHSLYMSIVKFVDDNNIKRIGVSLSGGIDSNVLLYILYLMKYQNIIDVVVAIHVDYGNRSVSMIESEYLNNVCRYFKIPMITRRIEHMKRIDDDIDRAFYEMETKNIRFGLYKYAIEKYNIEGVCLGHHQDDLTENVFMNIMRGKDLLDLFVMKQILISDGISIMRPMLDHHKKDIYEISHECNIMYFKDTTPDESFRGTIRRKIFPVIDKFDDNMLNNLTKIGKDSIEWCSVIEKTVINPILYTIKIGINGFSIILNMNISNLPSVFWSRLFVQLFHSQKTKMISRKNLTTFINWTNSENKNDVIIRLSNGYFVVHDELFDGRLYFLKSRLLFSDKKMTSVSFTNHMFVLNNWDIEIQMNTSEYIKNKMTYDDVMNGYFEYTKMVKKNNVFTFGYVLNSRDNLRKSFGSLKKLSSNIPKCLNNIHDNDDENIVIKVVMRYI